MDLNEQRALDLYSKLTEMSPTERREWFRTATTVDKKVLRTLAFSWPDDAMSVEKDNPQLKGWQGDGFNEPIADVYDTANQYQALVDAADRRAQAAVDNPSGGQPNPDLDGDGVPSPLETRLTGAAVKEKAGQRVQGDPNIPEAEKAAAADDLADTLLGQTAKTPDWLLQLNEGQPFDDTTIRRLITTWNNFNPQAPVSDEEGLFEAMKYSQNPLAQNVAQYVFMGEDPVMDYRVAVGPNQFVTIQGEQFDAAQKFFQGDFDAKELTYFVRLASQIDLKDGAGDVAWQPLAAIARALGLTDAAAVGAGGGTTGFGSDSAYTKSPSLTQAVDGEAAKPRYANSTTLLSQAAVKYKNALSQYGNVGLAYLATIDAGLAAKLATTPADKWANLDVLKANQIFIKGGFAGEDTNLGRMGYSVRTDQTLVDVGTKENGLGREAAAAQQRTMPDPVALRQAAKDLYKSMYLADPTEDQLNSFVSQVQSQVSSAPDNQQVEPSARLRDLIEKDGAYRELYGKMPKGMTESEYQGQFRAAAASMLGQQAPDGNTIRSGMRTGEYQTTVGAAAGSKAAWGNSTFLGRLATAAQVVAENT